MNNYGYTIFLYPELIFVIVAIVRNSLSLLALSISG
jgi:hypothetical protein